MWVWQNFSFLMICAQTTRENKQYYLGSTTLCDLYEQLRQKLRPDNTLWWISLWGKSIEKYFHRKMVILSNFVLVSGQWWRLNPALILNIFALFISLPLIFSVPLCSGVIINELMDLTANIGKCSSRSALSIAVVNISYCFSHPNFNCLNVILIKQIQNGLIQQLEGLYLSLFSNTTQVSALSLKNSSELVNQRIIKIL